MQFGFIKGKGTTDAIFMARQMQENFSVKGKKLYFDFVDLEKASDRVLREVVVVVTFFNHNFVNCKATLILAIKIYEIKYNISLNDRPIHT